MESKSIEQKVKDLGYYFDKISISFIEEYEKKGLKKHTDIIFEFFDKKDLSSYTVLELGCGLGGLLLKFIEKGAKHVYGVDLSEKMIETAKRYAESKKLSERTDFYVGDFNRVKKGLLPIDQADIVVADRVLCCSPVALEIMENMIGFNPKFIVAVQPRKNVLASLLMYVRIKIRQYKLKVKNHGVKNPYVPVRDYDKLCKENDYQRVLQKFRYGWEILIYERTDEI
jgi:tRNA1(Val) A37 N6-methylase TrmN6